MWAKRRGGFWGDGMVFMWPFLPPSYTADTMAGFLGCA